MEVLSYFNGFDFSMFVDIVLNVLFGILCVRICNSHSFLLDIDYFRKMTPSQIELHSVTFWSTMMLLFTDVKQQSLCFNRVCEVTSKAKEMEQAEQEENSQGIEDNKPIPDNVVTFSK